MLTLSELLNLFQEGEVAKATYGIREKWYITFRNGHIFYCDESGQFSDDGIVSLTFSNRRAYYEIIR